MPSSEAQLRADIVEVGRRLYARGYTASNDGNISVRLDQSRLLVTARKFPEHGVTTDELPELKQIEKRATALDAPELVALPQRDADAA